MIVYVPYAVSPRDLHSFPTRRSSDLTFTTSTCDCTTFYTCHLKFPPNQSRTNLYECFILVKLSRKHCINARSEEHTSELQSHGHLVCCLLLEKKNKRTTTQ